MPWVKTPANITVRELFTKQGSQEQLRKRARMSNGTFHRRKTHPEDIRLEEFGKLSAELEDAEIVKIVRAWK